MRDSREVRVVAVQEGVTSIDNRAFDGCTELTTIAIPSSVTSIGDNAFCGGTGLTTITIHSSVTSIGEEAFYGWTDLVKQVCGCAHAAPVGCRRLLRRI